MFPTIDENLDCFAFEIVTSTDALSTCVHVLWWTYIHISVGYMPKGKIFWVVEYACIYL